MQQYVVLAHQGRLLELATRDHDTRLWATGAEAGPSSILVRVDLDHGRVALRTLDGRYLSCRPDPGHNYGLYPVDELGPREVFEEVLWPDDRISLRSCELTYVSAEEAPRRRVVVNRTEAGEAERLTYLPAPSGLVPAQARRLVARPAEAR